MSKNKLSLLAGPFIALILITLFDFKPGEPQVTATAAIALWMAIWWIFEAVPLAVTALLPIVLFPALGVLDGKSISNAYINHIIFLFIGGFLIALAMQRWKLDKRIALAILSYFGHSPATVLLGFMCTTAFLSMWISNTATAMMMVPVVLAIINNIEEQFSLKNTHKLATGFLLAIAYSASIGGIATLIGTPPNLSFARILQISFVEAPDINFANWLAFALPISLCMFMAAWALLYLFYIKPCQSLAFDRAYFKETYKKLGPATQEQKMVFAAFLSMAGLWLFRADIQIGTFFIPGWSSLFANPGFFNDGTVAIFIALLLFIIPSRNENTRLLDAQVFTQIPWHIVILFGGGFALATGFIHSGLSAHLAEQLTEFKGVSAVPIIISICLLTTFLTELSSNTATTEMFLPVLGAMAIGLEINPLLLMIPATLSASFAFMLPVATPPNAIIFGTNRVKVIDMAKTGISLNLLGACLITLASLWLAPVVFDFDPDSLPDWAVLTSHSAH